MGVVDFAEMLRESINDKIMSVEIICTNPIILYTMTVC
jgi:hypothetical protein